MPGIPIVALDSLQQQSICREFFYIRANHVPAKKELTARYVPAITGHVSTTLESVAGFVSKIYFRNCMPPLSTAYLSISTLSPDLSRTSPFSDSLHVRLLPPVVPRPHAAAARLPAG